MKIVYLRFFFSFLFFYFLNLNLIFSLFIFHFKIWNAIRLSKLERETDSLKNVITNMKKRLGLDYLDELDRFEEAVSIL